MMAQSGIANIAGIDGISKLQGAGSDDQAPTERLTIIILWRCELRAFGRGGNIGIDD